MLNGVQLMLADGADASFGLEVKTAIAAFIVGTVVGMTGMGGGALMTPALIFLGVGDASAVVTADLTAAAIFVVLLGGGWLPSAEASASRQRLSATSAI